MGSYVTCSFVRASGQNDGITTPRLLLLRPPLLLLLRAERTRTFERPRN